MKDLSMLWQMVLDVYVEDFAGYFGLCFCVDFLRDNKKISRNERLVLRSEIYSEAKKIKSDPTYHLWDIEDKKARIKFIKSRIETHKPTPK